MAGIFRRQGAPPVPPPAARPDSRHTCPSPRFGARDYLVTDSERSRSLRFAQKDTAMNTPPIVSPQEWNAAREKLLVKEKAHTHARDALAAERRRMPWMAVQKTYAFDGPKG